VARAADELAEALPEVDLWLPAGRHGELPARLAEKWAGGPPPEMRHRSDRSGSGRAPITAFAGFGQRTLLTPSHTAYLKVSEGCSNACTFCSIPLMRGEQRSRPIRALVDEGSFEETFAAVSSVDPLSFRAAKPYVESLARSRAETERAEAAITGRATIDGHRVAVGAMDFRFIGASMGSAVGEKITRLFDLAVDERRGVVLVIASGGARMQEGMLSLMQMAKTAAAAERLAREGLPYVSVLVNPTYGGVMASFAALADVIFAEPGALVGFAGPRLVEETVRHSLPKGFQSAESLVEHGMIDAVVPRAELREKVSTVLGYLCAHGPRSGEGEA